MTVQHNISLLPYNTFGIQAYAECFLEITDTLSLAKIATNYNKIKVIGGGSNVLLTQNIEGLVLYNATKGIAICKETEEHVWLKVASGEVWHHLVMYAVAKGWGGLENLALIPGTVGASPMQNIGAYGVEAKDVIESVTYFDWVSHQYHTLNNASCEFGYRDSIFKNSLKDKIFITEVTYKLNKHPKLNTSYGAIEDELNKMNITNTTVADVAQAVINIRSSKLPNPKEIGNAGSFFKNPTISKPQYALLQQQYPSIPSYPVSDSIVKVPAGWLIEQAGWKGYRTGDIGVHAKQALVLVNYANANGAEIWELSGRIVADIKHKFSIELEREVQVW